MAVETYKWLRPDTTLRADYGGGTVAAFGDSREPDPKTCTHRYVCQKLGLPAGATRYLWETGTATDGNLWIRVPDLLYSAISSWLSTYELSTVTSTIPTGWVRASGVSLLQPNPSRKALIHRGDSIGFGLGTTSGDTKDTWFGQAISGITGETIKWDGSATEGVSDTYQLLNMSLGGSSFANTVDAGNGSAAYPLVEALAYNQRTKTLPMNSAKVAFIYSLGTNDNAYDTSLTGAQQWARVVTRLAALRADFPKLRVAITTIAKRTENATLNGRANDRNVLARANYLSAGADILLDFEANVVKLNMTTGDTTNTANFTDGTHWTTSTHADVAAYARSPLQSLVA